MAMPSPRLAEISKSVAKRLARTPGVQMVPGNGIELYCRQNFLSDEECGGLIAMIGSNLRPSTLVAMPGRDDSAFRTSFSCDLDRWHPFIAAIDQRICDLLGLKPRMGESLQGQRYDVGQLFRAHHDYFHPATPYWQETRKQGGQRSWTAMIYLDEPDGGGETVFPNAGLSISPRKAMLVAWNNMQANGDPNEMSLHESVPVSAGVKTIVTKWFRERFWI